MGSEIEVTSDLSGLGFPYGMINETGGELSTYELANDPQVRQLAEAMTGWVNNARASTGRGSMFDRAAFTPPENPYDEMRAARTAVQYDSVVAGVAEVTEAFAFQGVKWEGSDPDDADVFNQLSRDLNLDSVMRRMWREEFTYGQFIAAKLWGWQEYTVRGRTTKGNRKKRRYKVWVPLRIVLLDSLKCVPVGIGPLREDRICWQATVGEIGDYGRIYRGENLDPLMLSFFEGVYQPTFMEAAELAQIRVDISRLLLMNRDWVWRHTMTKSDYQRFPDIRLKSVFKLLDLKQQVMNADRASLIGAANYILLIRKGDDKLPATGPELDNLAQKYQYIAKLPVIISDHRLTIDIIAPKTDLALDSQKYDMIDQRLLNRLLGTLTNGSKGGSRTDNQATTAMPVARTMENRRHMLKRSVEMEIARAVVNHPKNAGVFVSEPNLIYTPRNINLALDAAYGQALLALRTQREISRETILEFYGMDEATEAMRMEMEADYYDDIFKTEIPYTAGQPAEGVDPAVNKKAQQQEGIIVTPSTNGDGSFHVAPGGAAAKKTAAAPAKKTAAAPAKKTAATTKDPANKDPNSIPASGQPTGKTAKKPTPNKTAESPKVSGARGGRPLGGGKATVSPTKTAKAAEEEVSTDE